MVNCDGRWRLASCSMSGGRVPKEMTLGKIPSITWALRRSCGILRLKTMILSDSGKSIWNALAHEEGLYLGSVTERRLWFWAPRPWSFIEKEKFSVLKMLETRRTRNPVKTATSECLTYHTRSLERFPWHAFLNLVEKFTINLYRINNMRHMQAKHAEQIITLFLDQFLSLSYIHNHQRINQPLQILYIYILSKNSVHYNYYASQLIHNENTPKPKDHEWAPPLPPSTPFQSTTGKQSNQTQNSLLTTYSLHSFFFFSFCFLFLFCVFVFQNNLNIPSQTSKPQVIMSNIISNKRWC